MCEGICCHIYCFEKCSQCEFRILTNRRQIYSNKETFTSDPAEKGLPFRSWATKSNSGSFIPSTAHGMQSSHFSMMELIMAPASGFPVVSRTLGWPLFASLLFGVWHTATPGDSTRSQPTQLEISGSWELLQAGFHLVMIASEMLRCFQMQTQALYD